MSRVLFFLFLCTSICGPIDYSKYCELMVHLLFMYVEFICIKSV